MNSYSRWTGRRSNRAVLELLLEPSELAQLFGEAPPREDDWFAIETGAPIATATEYIGGLGVEPVPREVQVGMLRRIAGRELDALRTMFQAQPDAEARKRLFDWRRARFARRHRNAWPPTIVTVLNVGQGNCNAIGLPAPTPDIYFDFGGGCYWNSHTYRSPLALPVDPDRTLIVLSHWDADHWFSGWCLSASHDALWLAPRQSMGPRGVEFARALLRKGRLIWWPDDLTTFYTGLGRIRRCRGTSRNDSGLAMDVPVRRKGRGKKLRRRRILLPADAAYDAIPIEPDGWQGLVASHHGGHARGRIPTPSRGRGCIVYSYGERNRHGHPTAASRAAHHDAGWTETRETTGGHHAFGPAGLDPVERIEVAMLHGWAGVTPTTICGGDCTSNARRTRPTRIPFDV